MNKTNCILYMLNFLLDNGYLLQDTIMKELDINTLTFYRYIKEIKEYFTNYKKAYNLIYSRSDNCYYLKKIIEENKE